MTLHREGYRTIGIVGLLVGIGALAVYLAHWPLLPSMGLWLLLAAFWLFIVSFFRLPNRPVLIDENLILAPADGKIVVIEETTETEYFNDRRLMVSIFMSPLNVHVNLYPFSGAIEYFRYHKGKYLVASLPKAALENERTTTVLRNPAGKRVLIRQVAGAVARRIAAYAVQGHQVEQGEELGFIKFGSRVDLYLPLGTKLDVQLGQRVRGKQTVIGRWN